MKRLWIAVAALFMGGPLLAQGIERPDPAKLRERIEELKRQREAREASAPSIPAIPTTRSPAVPVPQKSAGICLVNDMPKLRAVWRFEPLDAQPGGTLVYPVLMQGERWISLAAGRWRITADAGDPATGEMIALGGTETNLVSGRRYEIQMEERLEERLRGLMKRNREATANAVSTTRPAPPSGKPDPTPQPSGQNPSVRVEINR